MMQLILLYSMMTAWYPEAVHHRKPLLWESIARLCIALVNLLLSDYLLWGEKLPGSLLWVRHRLLRHAPAFQSMQLYPGGEWMLGPIWETQLLWFPVCVNQGRVPRLSALDGLQWHHSILPYNFLREYLMRMNYGQQWTFFPCIMHLVWNIVSNFCFAW